MVIQKWTAKMMPLQRSVFIETLKELNALYRKYDRVEWGRIHSELYGGHVVFMERDFKDIAGSGTKRLTATPASCCGALRISSSSATSCWGPWQIASRICETRAAP